MLFYEEIHTIRRHADAIDRASASLGRIEWDTADLRRFDLRQAARELRAAADRCDAVADRFEEPVAVDIMEAAE